MPVEGQYHATCKNCGVSKLFPAVQDEGEKRSTIKMGRRKKGEEHKPSETGKHLKQPSMVQKRHQEYVLRKEEIIKAFLDCGRSSYRAGRILHIPETSIRQLVRDWTTDIETKDKVEIPPVPVPPPVPVISIVIGKTSHVLRLKSVHLIFEPEEEK